ncbi:MAG: glycine betaine/L-proline ABC transporter ATP-binding protein [Acholeplasmataceae bacterium]|nr:glycine betaine/L-proline ABC transporter ATP-binding protein [Acholeplasmataceae bacterium]
MASIQIDHLSKIFGHPKAVEKALEMLQDNKDPKEIGLETNTTIALNDVSFTIEDQELFVIVGLSGSGKSTLIRCLNLLNKPTTGQIFLDKQEITNLNKQELRDFRRKRVSMVFQHFGLLSHRTIIKNVEYGLEIQGVDRKTRTEKALETLEIVGLKGWEDKKPHQLSGGMKQRVGLARAIVTEPEILLMDEPYSALDPLIRREMQNELLTLEDYINRTIVFITHDMNEAFKMGDRIALMKDGKIIQIGTPQEFFSNPVDDYVVDFISDVDKTQIFKARNIVRKDQLIVDINDLRQEVLAKMKESKVDVCYVVDDKKMYMGQMSKEDVAKSRAKTIDKLIVHVEPILRNTYLKDLWSRFENYDENLPVVDSKGKFRGVLSKDDMISVLAQ